MFILRQLVREVLDDTDLADPGLVADEVLSRIPRGKIREALTQALRHYVRQVISEDRNSTAPVPTPINPSVKVAAIRDGWQRRLHDRVHVGKAAWKLLADCTYEDLVTAATERRELSDRNLARARQFDAWARLVNEHEAATFGDLPVGTLADILGRAA